MVYAAGWIGIGRMWGVAVAMIVTVVMTWKLKLNFAMGAIVSLLHDVFLTLGMLTLLNREIDLNIIAALLTLVGYSLNDTIIVFDRHPRKSAQYSGQGIRGGCALHGHDHQLEHQPDTQPHLADLGHHPWWLVSVCTCWAAALFTILP